MRLHDGAAGWPQRLSPVRSARAMGREGGQKGFPQSLKRFGGDPSPGVNHRTSYDTDTVGPTPFVLSGSGCRAWVGQSTTQYKNSGIAAQIIRPTESPGEWIREHAPQPFWSQRHRGWIAPATGHFCKSDFPTVIEEPLVLRVPDLPKHLLVSCPASSLNLF